MMTRKDIAAIIGPNIRYVRLARGLKQRELATAAGYGSGGAVCISGIETSANLPSWEMFYSIAAALSIHPSELLNENLFDKKARDNEDSKKITANSLTP